MPAMRTVSPFYKGFGAKTQQNVIVAIEFYLQNQGHFLFAQLETLFPQVEGYLKTIFSPATVRVTGAYRRQELTIEELEFLVLEDIEAIKPKFQTKRKIFIFYFGPNSLKLNFFFRLTSLELQTKRKKQQKNY